MFKRFNKFKRFQKFTEPLKPFKPFKLSKPLLNPVSHKYIRIPCAPIITVAAEYDLFAIR